jgi:3',5'-cyclic AMP phosphodiesterase CpdA
MAHAAVHSDLLEPVVDIGNWRVTLLDSAVPGSVPGYLQDSQLQLLAQALSEAPSVITWCVSTIIRCPSAAPGWSRSACAIPRRCSLCWTVSTGARRAVGACASGNR